MRVAASISSAFEPWMFVQVNDRTRRDYMTWLGRESREALDRYADRRVVFVDREPRVGGLRFGDLEGRRLPSREEGLLGVVGS